MTREEKLRAVKYAIYAAVMLLAYVLCAARGVMPQLWGARMNPLPFLLCIIALYEGPYVGAGFGLFAGLLVSLHSLTAEGLASLYLGLFGLAFGLVAVIWLRPILLNAMLGGALCLLLQGVGRYLFYHGLVLGVPMAQDALQVAGELLLALVPGLLLCLLIRKIHTTFEEVLEH